LRGAGTRSWAKRPHASRRRSSGHQRPYRLLKTIMGTAVEDGLIRSNPTWVTNQDRSELRGADLR
jgi:hypothetical protein